MEMLEWSQHLIEWAKEWGMEIFSAICGGGVVFAWTQRSIKQKNKFKGNGYNINSKNVQNVITIENQTIEDIRRQCNGGHIIEINGNARNNVVNIQEEKPLSLKEVIATVYAACQENYIHIRKESQDFINQQLSEMIGKIGVENLRLPKARILAPIIRNLNITEEKDLREMYARLLASTMDKTCSDIVHPRFVSIIEQLTPDEAKILKYIHEHKLVPMPLLTTRWTDEKEEHSLDFVEDFFLVPYQAQCDRPDKGTLYLHNLIGLGLLQKTYESRLSDESLYVDLKNHPKILKLMSPMIANGLSKIGLGVPVFVEGMVIVTSLCASFCHVCLSLDSDNC